MPFSVYAEISGPEKTLTEQINACIRTEKFNQDLNNAAAENMMQDIRTRPKLDNRSSKVIDGYCRDEIPRRVTLKQKNDEMVVENKNKQIAQDALDKVENEKRAGLAKVEQEKLRLIREQHIADLKNKMTQPLTISDAIVFYGAENGAGIVAQPPIFKDNHNYFVRGVIENLSGGTLILNSSSPQFPIYFFAIFDGDTKYMEGFSPRINGGATIVGEFVDLKNYITTAGQSKVAPEFRIVAIGK